MIEVRTGDRAGLLYALGQSLAKQQLSIRSAHISTLAGQAIDTFYLTEADGSAPSPQRGQRAVEVLTAAAALTSDVAVCRDLSRPEPEAVPWLGPGEAQPPLASRSSTSARSAGSRPGGSRRSMPPPHPGAANPGCSARRFT